MTEEPMWKTLLLVVAAGPTVRVRVDVRREKC